MKVIESLKNILIEQVGSYRVLLDLLQKEREYLLNLQVSEVEYISKEKDTIALRVRLLEDERLRLMKEFSTESGIECDSSLRRLSDLLGDDTFNVLRLQLVSLLQCITELNDFNRILIERSLTVVNNGLLFLEPFNHKGNQKLKGTLLSREV